MPDERDSPATLHAVGSGLTAGVKAEQRAGRDAVGRDKSEVNDNSTHVASNSVVNINVWGRRSREQQRPAVSHFETESLERLHGDPARRLADKTGRDLVSLSLAFEQSLGALPLRLSSYEQVSGRPSERLAAGTTLRDIYDSCQDSGGRRVLVLGDPGAGKTTSLLELATDLADAADERVPVYLPVSRWSQRSARRKARLARLTAWRQADRFTTHPMTLWLADQIEAIHQVDAEFAQRWLEDGRLLLIIDGLDEVADAAEREAFVKLLNDFLTIYPLPIVLSSRRAEYEALQHKVNFDEAVIIRSLEAPDVTLALQAAGPRLSGALAAVQQDPVLLELCRAPFLLQVLAYSYVDVDVEQIASEGDQRERLQGMLADYVRRQLGADGAQQVSPAVSLRALTGLARRLARRRFTEFHMQDMDLQWVLPNSLVVYLLRVGMLAAVLALCGAGWFLSAQASTWMAAFWHLSAHRSWMRDNLSWRRVVRWVGVAEAVAVIAIVRNWSFLSTVDVGPFTSLPWWVNVLGLGLIDGLCVGVVAAGIGPTPPSRSTSPYAGLRRMALNGIIGAAVAGLLAWIAAALTLDVAGTAQYASPIFASLGLQLSVGLALVVGLSIGLYLGLGKIVDHVLVRLVLLGAPAAPVRYVAWLENMVERRLVYRAGSGYVFQHQLLRDYLAGPTA